MQVRKRQRLIRKTQHEWSYCSDLYVIEWLNSHSWKFIHEPKKLDGPPAIVAPQKPPVPFGDH